MPSSTSCTSGEWDRSAPDDGVHLAPATDGPAPRRTGATGRPGARSGDVTIESHVTWGTNPAGTGGTITAEPSVTPFQRIVDEVQPVVDGAGG